MDRRPHEKASLDVDRTLRNATPHRTAVVFVAVAEVPSGTADFSEKQAEMRRENVIFVSLGRAK